MSDLRNLLLDCRSALRRANRRFEEDPLRVKLDEAINEFTRNDDDDELAEPETRTAQQVAYAWQIATRSIKLTHPDLYAKLAKRVHEMLDTQVLSDPATEFLKLEAQLQSAAAEQESVEKELAELRRALSDAVPLTGRDAKGTDTECDLRRIQILIDTAARGTTLTSGSTPAKQILNDDPVDISHNREELQAVAAGRRPLSKWERSWCLAEALVMTDKNSEQLGKLPDSELVKLVLATG